ncbi:MAG: filamentous hemagglutinin N-terminal domain-containing protein [Nostoc sp.]|uniref:two-partner secretion domain-containing protein n=1 Tax=Nostoc sp. TaxID=1180 RepID=UPI002FFBA65B
MVLRSPQRQAIIMQLSLPTQSFNQTTAINKKFFNLCLKIASACSLFGIAAFVQTPVFAQSAIAPDNTLGAESSNVVTNFNSLPVEVITGGATRGINLFHSFREFNVSEGRSAYFLSPSADIQNILARVTGSNRSEILGRLGTFQIINGNIAASNASLFLINPNGIIFGKNASLDVDGSFAATTANAIQFGERGNFSATNPKVPQLLTINPSAFLFSQINKTASIQNNAIATAGQNPSSGDAFGLRVPDGKSLLLVGGNISMDGGQLNAYGGRVELGGLAEPGNVNLFFDRNNLRLGFPENVTSADVLFTNQAAIRVQGAGGGDIAVNARNLEILGGSSLFAGIGEGLGTPETVAGDITLNATGEIRVADRSRIANFVFPRAKGNGGNISINSGSFLFPNDAQISASTLGQGNAGNVTVRAKDAVSLVDGSIFSTVEAGGVGKGGNIDIIAATLSLTDGTQLLAFTREADDNQPAGQGNAGNVNVRVTGTVDIAGEKNDFPSGIRSLVATGTEGNGGNITIDASSFSLRDGARLNASTYGQGNAGNIDINVTGAVTIYGRKDRNVSAIFTDVEEGAKGNGGNITINSDSFSLRDGTQLIASTSGQGNAGNVTVRAKDAVSLVDGGSILSTVQAGGVGKGGNIDINAATISLRDGAQLQTITFGASDTQPAGRGDAGNVNVKVIGDVDIASQNSAIGSLVDIGTVGNGGNITIDAGSFKLRDGAFLEASTYGQGNAGNVAVSAKDAVSLTGGDIFSTVEAGSVGKGGNIDINAASLSLTDGAQLLTITRGASDTQLAGRGDAGNVNIDVMGAVTITGRKGTFPSGILTNVEQRTTGNGGNVTINSSSFSLTSGAAVFTSTDGKGNAGNVTVNARESVLLRNPDNAIFSTVLENGEGKGGNIEINTASFSILNAAGVTAETRGLGDAGNVKINAINSVTISGKVSEFIAGLYTSSIAGASGKILGDAGNIEVNSLKVTLDNGGTIDAESASGNGGNINLNSNLLLLRRGSKITTNAGTAQAGGDGGNIDISSRFIVAIPNQNNDITANAYSGKGGNINIQSRGIFGIEPRAQASDKTNDITASSQLGLLGNVDVNSPDNSSIQNSLTSFPTNAIDTNALIANSCIARANKKQENSFIITGGGALPNRPGDVLMSNYSTDRVRGVNNEITLRPWKKGDPIVEPTGVYRLSDGRLVMSRECE